VPAGASFPSFTGLSDPLQKIQQVLNAGILFKLGVSFLQPGQAFFYVP
jgi:hypothetical protein